MNTPTRRRFITGGALALGAVTLRSTAARAASDDGVSHSAEAIHQEPVFTADRARVYAVLLDPKQFDRVVELSGALQAMHLQAKPCVISPHAGGAFALFGGVITGRQIALVPNELVVQAWRADDWPRGVYSIARFELVAQGSGCKILFDHTGFPQGDAESLASGWRAHYWKPMQQLLS